MPDAPTDPALLADPEVAQAVLLDHGRHPRSTGVCPGETVGHLATNPLCGDEVRVSLSLDADGLQLDCARFTGAGCTVSQAAASLLTSLLPGQTPQQALALCASLRGKFQTWEGPALPGSLEALAFVRNNPGRRRCALVIADAVEQALTGLG